jgi:CBS-domain-containing membrane protein
MTTVGDVMTTSVLAVRPDTTLKEVANLLVEHRISGLPVVDEAGRVVGVVSEADLLVKEQEPGALARGPLDRIFGESQELRQQRAKAEARTAGEAMTAPAITVDASRTVHQAASLMIERRVNRLPVVEDGRLVGIVTRADLVRSFVRSDEQLEATIREDVLLKALWIDPAQFTVDVSDGVVTLKGAVDRRSTAEMVAQMVGMVPGVVGVSAEIAWNVDDREIDAPAPDYFSPKGPS